MFRRNRPKPIYAPKIRVSKGETLSVWERYFERALHNYATGEMDDALLDIEAAIEANPRNGELHATRGMFLLEAGKTDDAMEVFDTAQKFDQRQWVVDYLRGLHAFRQKNYDSAIEHLTTALLRAPLRPEALYLRAMAYYARGEIVRARDEVQKAVDNVTDKKNKSLRDMKKFLTQLKREAKAEESSK